VAVQTGLLAVSKNTSYTNQTVNPNTVGVKIGSFMLQNQSSSEPVNVTSMAVGLAIAAPTYVSGATLTVGTGSQTWTLADGVSGITNPTDGITVGNTVTLSDASVGTIVMTVASKTNNTITGTTVVAGGTVVLTGTHYVVGTGSTSLAALTNFSNLRTSQTSGSGATPIQPATTNNFSVNFQILPGQTQEVDVLADTSTANMGQSLLL